MTRTCVSIYVHPEFVKIIDQQKGTFSRSSFVESILHEKLKTN